MAQCYGDQVASTKIDASMQEFLQEEANRLGITKAELHRRLLDSYRDHHENKTPCPHCEQELDLDLTSSSDSNTTKGIHPTIPIIAVIVILCILIYTQNQTDNGKPDNTDEQASQQGVANSEPVVSTGRRDARR